MSDTQLSWDTIARRFDELTEQASSPTLESSKRHQVQKELSYINTLLTKHKEIVRLEEEKSALQKHLEEQSQSELAELYKEEIASTEALLEKERKAELNFYIKQQERYQRQCNTSK